MLKKLIKYDFKALNRYLLLIHAFLLAAAAAVRIFLTEPLRIGDSRSVIVSTFGIILFVLIAVGISFATSLLTAIRFYKNLFSDEGYLTLTLPVTRGQHLFSKTIVGTAWCLLDQLLLLGSIFLIFHAEPLRDLFNANKAELLEAFGFTGAYADLTLLKIALYVLLFLLISALSSVIMIYASIVIGQLFTNHRVLGSVICYIGLTTLLSIISYALLFALGLVSLKVTDTSMSMQYFSTVSYMVKALNLSMILALVTSVILYTITYQLMRVKLNLN
ncbi:MAG: hypothetical protein KHW38_01875 [Dorea sp.]|nr:hypothetical protein [Dorea sp.]